MFRDEDGGGVGCRMDEGWADSEPSISGVCNASDLEDDSGCSGDGADDVLEWVRGPLFVGGPKVVTGKAGTGGAFTADPA
jgi:hypothetical protein